MTFYEVNMKKSVVLLGGVCAVAIVAGIVLYSAKTGSVGDYWDGSTAINEIAKDGNLPLVKAILNKDFASAKKLIEKGALPTTANKDGLNAIDAAVLSGDVKMLELFAAPLVLSSPKYMEEAIDSNSIDMIKAVLANGGNANAILKVKGKYRPDDVLDYQDPRVLTPLKKAVEDKKAAVADFLIKNGAEGAEFFLTQELTKAPADVVIALAKNVPNLRDKNVHGSDLLTAAVAEGSPELLEFLLQENVGDINTALEKLLLNRAKDNHFNEALDMFLKQGARPEPQVLEMLVKNKDTELFNKLTNCMTNPNVYLSYSDESLIKYAMRTHNVAAIKTLLDKGVDIWATEKDGQTLLEAAVNDTPENQEIYELFKAKLKNINETGYKGETLLMLLAKAGNYNEFKKVLDAGGDIWQKDLAGKTVLMYAAEGDKYSIITELLAKGDNMEATDNAGKTPMMYAAESSALEAFQTFLERSASHKAKDKAGRNVAIYAAKGGNAQILNILLDLGESPAAFDNEHKTLLMYAVESGNLETVQSLEKKGIDVFAQDNDYNSVLIYAVKGGNPDVVRLILKNRADRLAQNKQGYQPATWAIIKGNKEILDILGVSPSNSQRVTIDNGRTLPMYAIDGGNVDIIQWSINGFKEDLNKKDHNGQSAMMLLAKYGRPDAVREALVHGGNASARDNDGKSVLMYAAESETAVNLIMIIKSMIGDGATNIRDKNGKTALMYAVGGKYNQTIKQQRLLQYDADVNAADIDGKTVLMYAVGNQLNKVDAMAVSELLAKVKDINQKDKNGKTALMYAAESPMSNIRVLETMLRAGADIKAKDNAGKTALMYAAMSGDMSKYRLLLSKGADASARSNEGKTAADYAKNVGSCFADAVNHATK